MLKNTHIWFPEYLRGKLRKKPRRKPVTVLFAMADHFEPEQRPSDPLSLQVERVREWIERFEGICGRCRDSDGNPPVHTYFYPQEQYSDTLLEMLSSHCHRGFGEVEIHIHHDRETEEGFLSKISEFKQQLASHRLLSRDAMDQNKIKYGFVHGNWALDNARPDGRWCGLNNEITLLRETGCYADFTLPSAPAEGQTRKINSIYFSDDDPLRPKSHDRGRDLVFGAEDSGDLLLIQGPLTLNWHNRSRHIFPRIENGEINSRNPITAQRIRLWLEARISVRDREDVIFVKTHCHGMKPRNSEFLLGNGMENGFSLLEEYFSGLENCTLKYVTAREMANIALAYNDGVDPQISELRDHRLKWPW